MAFTNQSLVFYNSVRTPFRNLLDSIFHILQTGDRSHGNPVVHWNNDRPPGVSVDDSLYSNPFA
jgi:hypothetical protein